MTIEPHGQFLPADHSKGDASTVGGYAAVHARPAALEGRDGMSYSLEVLADTTGETTPGRRYGAYLLFVQWKRIGDQGVAGHLESAFLAWADSIAQAKQELGAMRLDEAQGVLDDLIVGRDTGSPVRRWWDATRDDSRGA
ncbi:MAG: hypothetical protein ACHQQ3_05280 [Gemmatimonadales bacterium]